MALTVRFFPLWMELVCAALLVQRGNPVSRVLLRGATPCHVRVPFWFHSTRSTCALFYSVREHWPRLDLVAIELGIPCFDQYLHLWMWCGRAVLLTMEAYGISTPSSARLLTSPSGYLQIVHVHVSFLQKWGLAVLARVPSFAESSVDK